MLHHNINQLLQEAKKGLSASEHELSRPYEDVVVFSACHSTRTSIRKLLTTMIEYYYSINIDAVMDRKLDQLDKWSISRLIDQCIEINPAFENLDYTVLACQMDLECGEPSYCITEEKVEECTRLGRKIESIVSKYISNHESAARVKERRNNPIN